MTILYFSGTGNSYATARGLADENTRLIDMAKDMPVEISDDAVGIVCPIYCSDAPLRVLKFIDNVTIKSDYVFLVATSGGGEGHIVKSINYHLYKKSKITLSYADIIKMPDSCIIFATKPQDIPIKLANQVKKVEELKKVILGRQKRAYGSCKSPLVDTKIMWWYMNKVLKIERKTVSDTCIKCSKCVKHCPMDNIVLTDKIRFLDRCENCFGCIQICPTSSISFGKVKVSKETRYYNSILDEEE